MVRSSGDRQYNINAVRSLSRSTDRRLAPVECSCRFSCRHPLDLMYVSTARVYNGAYYEKPQKMFSLSL